jgi:outer membrane protein assembly factor BamB
MIRTLVCLAAGLGLLAPGAAANQKDEFSKAISLSIDNRIQANLEILPQYTAGDGWPTAIGILQDILDSPDDCFVPVQRAGATLWVGARAEALRQLAALPKEGQAVYALLANPPAKEMLDQTRRLGDWRRLAEIARRYPFTPSGLTAVRQLGLQQLDRGDATQAARWFDLWLRRDTHWQDDGAGALAAWLAYSRSGRSASAAEVWKQLQTRHPGGVTLGQRKVALAALKKQFDVLPAIAAPPGGWWVFGGSGTRTGVDLKVPALQAALWNVTTVNNATARALFDNSVRLQEARPQPVVPGSFPIFVDDKVVVRTADGIQAISAQTGKTLWEAPFPRSLERLFTDDAARQHLVALAMSYQTLHPHILLENSNLGCLSCDGQRIYAVDDIPLLPFVSKYARNRVGMDFALHGIGVTTDRSTLRALDVASGEVLWETPGAAADGPMLFLGPPLPVQGKLYGVAEQNGALVLIGLEAQTGKLIMRQRLAVPQNRLAQDGGRRLQALHVSHDRGILVCPTGGGAVVAYDLVGGGLLWAHAYRDKPLKHGPRLKGIRPATELEIESIPNLRSPWQVTAPILQGGKVLHAAVDSPVLECLNLEDGALLWKADRVLDDLYLAGVHQGVVLVVGRKQCRGLRWQDGQEIWRTKTPAPSGQGLFADGTYWLPVKAGLARIDVLLGTVGDAMPLPTPGNLIIADGQLISQSVTAVASFGKKEE